MKALLIAGIAVAMLSGCATTKNWTATGGSRADATVRLSYSYGQFEKPQISEQQAQSLAASRCATWGYTGAEAFGGSEQKCTMSGGMGCAEFQVTKEYQCIGTGSAAEQNLSRH